MEALSELVARRDLVYILAWREIRVRYKQSVMGLLWAVLMPMVIVSAGMIVRYGFSRVSGNPLEISDFTTVAVKSAPWAYFVTALRFGTMSLIANSTLVTKIYMPRLAFPIAVVVAQLLDLVLASSVIAVLLAVAQAGISAQLLWLPAIVLCLILLVTGLVIILSAASLFLRDVKYIVDMMLTFAIFFTPVFYDSSLFGEWAPLILINPVSPLLEAISDTVILHQAPSLLWLLYSFTVTVLLLVVSLRVFTKLEPLFAESV